MITKDDLNQLYNIISENDTLTTKVLNQNAFDKNKIAKLIKDGFLKRETRGVYTFQKSDELLNYSFKLESEKKYEQSNKILEKYLEIRQDDFYNRYILLIKYIIASDIDGILRTLKILLENIQKLNPVKENFNYLLMLLDKIYILPDDIKDYISKLEYKDIKISKYDADNKEYINLQNIVKYETFKENYLNAIHGMYELYQFDKKNKRYNLAVNGLLKKITKKYYDEKIPFNKNIISIDNQKMKVITNTVNKNGIIVLKEDANYADYISAHNINLKSYKIPGTNEKFLMKINQVDIGDKYVPYMEAYKFYQDKNYDNFISIYQKKLDSDTTNEIYYAMLGIGNIFKNNFYPAIDYFVIASKMLQNNKKYNQQYMSSYYSLIIDKIKTNFIKSADINKYTHYNYNNVVDAIYRKYHEKIPNKNLMEILEFALQTDKPTYPISQKFIREKLAELNKSGIILLSPSEQKNKTEIEYILKSNPSYERFGLKKDYCLLINKIDKQDINQLLKESRDAYRKADYYTSIENYQKIIRSGYYEPRIFSMMAKTYLKLKKQDEAITYFSIARFLTDSTDLQERYAKELYNIFTQMDAGNKIKPTEKFIRMKIKDAMENGFTLFTEEESKSLYMYKNIIEREKNIILSEIGTDKKRYYLRKCDSTYDNKTTYQIAKANQYLSLENVHLSKKVCLKELSGVTVNPSLYNTYAKVLVKERKLKAAIDALTIYTNIYSDSRKQRIYMTDLYLDLYNFKKENGMEVNNYYTIDEYYHQSEIKQKNHFDEICEELNMINDQKAVTALIFARKCHDMQNEKLSMQYLKTAGKVFETSKCIDLLFDETEEIIMKKDNSNNNGEDLRKMLNDTIDYLNSISILDKIIQEQEQRKKEENINLPNNENKISDIINTCETNNSKDIFDIKVEQNQFKEPSEKEIFIKNIEKYGVSDFIETKYQDNPLITEVLQKNKDIIKEKIYYQFEEYFILRKVSKNTIFEDQLCILGIDAFKKHEIDDCIKYFKKIVTSYKPITAKIIKKAYTYLALAYLEKNDLYAAINYLKLGQAKSKHLIFQDSIYKINTIIDKELGIDKYLNINYIDVINKLYHKLGDKLPDNNISPTALMKQALKNNNQEFDNAFIDEKLKQLSKDGFVLLTPNESNKILELQDIKRKNNNVDAFSVKYNHELQILLTYKSDYSIINPVDFKNRALKAYENGDYDKCIVCCKTLLKNGFFNMSIYELLGNSYINTNNIYNAIDCFEVLKRCTEKNDNDTYEAYTTYNQKLLGLYSKLIEDTNSVTIDKKFIDKKIEEIDKFGISILSLGESKKLEDLKTILKDYPNIEVVDNVDDTNIKHIILKYHTDNDKSLDLMKAHSAIKAGDYALTKEKIAESLKDKNIKRRVFDVMCEALYYKCDNAKILNDFNTVIIELSKEQNLKNYYTNKITDFYANLNNYRKDNKLDVNSLRELFVDYDASIKEGSHHTDFYKICKDENMSDEQISLITLIFATYLGKNKDLDSYKYLKIANSLTNNRIIDLLYAETLNNLEFYNQKTNNVNIYKCTIDELLCNIPLYLEKFSTLQKIINEHEQAYDTFVKNKEHAIENNGLILLTTEDSKKIVEINEIVHHEKNVDVYTLGKENQILIKLNTDKVDEKKVLKMAEKYYKEKNYELCKETVTTLLKSENPSIETYRLAGRLEKMHNPKNDYYKISRNYKTLSRIYQKKS